MSTRDGGSTAATGLVALQGLLLAGIGAVLGMRAITGRPSDRLGAQLGACLAVATGLAVLLLARGLRRRRVWVRSPLIVLELLCLPVAWGLLQASKTLIAVVVAGAALLGIALVSMSTRPPAVPGETATRR